MIQENDMEEAFYRVWTQGTIYDITHYLAGPDSYKSWKEVSNEGDKPREDVAANLIQVIGRAIERKLNHHSNSQWQMLKYAFP